MYSPFWRIAAVILEASHDEVEDDGVHEDMKHVGLPVPGIQPAEHAATGPVPRADAVPETGREG